MVCLWWMNETLDNPPTYLVERFGGKSQAQKYSSRRKVQSMGHSTLSSSTSNKKFTEARRERFSEKKSD